MPSRPQERYLFFFTNPRARSAQGMIPLEGAVIDAEHVRNRLPPDQYTIRVVLHPIYAQLKDRESFLLQTDTPELQVGPTCGCGLPCSSLLQHHMDLNSIISLLSLIHWRLV